jgi:hypothetical protein
VIFGVHRSERALQFQGFGGQGAGGGNGAGVFVPQPVKAAAFAFFILPSSFCLPAVFPPHPLEQRAQGLLLAGGKFDQAPDEMESP